MGIQQHKINIFSGVKTLFYVFCAILAFTATYPFYKAISSLPNISPQAAIAISLAWWVAAFTVVYMGSWWMYTKKMEQSGENE